MKQSLTLALAAGLSQVSATGFHNFPPFPVPGNQDNKCTDKQAGGWGFVDLPTGDFSKYGNFDFSGFSCKEGFGKRGEVDARTFGNKGIVGTAHGDKSKCPSFGSKDKFSIGKYHVDVEFDCDLEFHYAMPDGSQCKHRQGCKKGGTVVDNKQCGGATSVTVVYPTQTAKPKPSCSIGFTSISFDCNSKSSTVPPKTYPTSSPSKPTSSVVISIPTPSVSKPGVSSTGAASTSTAVVSTKPAASSSSSVPSVPVSTSVATVATSTSVATVPASTSVATVPASSSVVTVPASSTVISSQIPPQSSYPVVIGNSTSSAFSSTAPVASTSVSTVATVPVSSVTVPVSSPITTTVVTSFQSTSTILTTVVSTVTNCGPSVTNCPAESVTRVTLTSVVGTTICPVTETQTTVISTAVPVPTYPAGLPSVPAPPAGQSSVTVPVVSSSVVAIPASSTATAPGQGSVSIPVVSSSVVAIPASSTATAPGPVETLPCPNVVPSCLNTWLFSSGCKDNTDSACFCPDSKFIENVFSCVYSYGGSDEVISEALSFVQGICAEFVPTNPGIATGVETYTTVLTAQPTTAPAASYTTVLVTATTVVPCTNSAGEVIPSSSSTQVISTTLTVPQVGFTTVVPSGPDGTPSVVPVVPTYAATIPGVPGVTVTSTRAPSATGGSGNVPAPGPVTTFTTAKPAGTGSQSVPTTTGVPVTAGAASVSSSFALVAGAVLAVLAAF